VMPVFLVKSASTASLTANESCVRRVTVVGVDDAAGAADVVEEVEDAALPPHAAVSATAAMLIPSAEVRVEKVRPPTMSSLRWHYPDQVHGSVGAPTLSARRSCELPC
jgi:hypothetical protein